MNRTLQTLHGLHGCNWTVVNGMRLTASWPIFILFLLPAFTRRAPRSGSDEMEGSEPA